MSAEHTAATAAPLPVALVYVCALDGCFGGAVYVLSFFVPELGKGF